MSWVRKRVLVPILLLLIFSTSSTVFLYSSRNSYISRPFISMSYVGKFTMGTFYHHSNVLSFTGEDSSEIQSSSMSESLLLKSSSDESPFSASARSSFLSPSGDVIGLVAASAVIDIALMAATAGAR